MKTTSATSPPKRSHRKNQVRRAPGSFFGDWIGWRAAILIFIAILLVGSCSGGNTMSSGQSFMPAVINIVKKTTANKRFIFKIKTKTGGIIGNISISAKDVFAAINKLRKRYPGCTILEAREKRENEQVTLATAALQKSNRDK